MNHHTIFSDKIYKEDPTQGILDWLQPLTVNLEDLEYMCSHIPLNERTQIRKATLQKWRYKKWKHSIIGDMKTVEHKSESRNNHQFSAVVQDLTIQWISPV